MELKNKAFGSAGDLCFFVNSNKNLITVISTANNSFGDIELFYTEKEMFNPEEFDAEEVFNRANRSEVNRIGAKNQKN